MSAALRLAPLRLRRVGSGPAAGGVGDIVLLHGWGSDSRVWHDLAPLLGRYGRVHLLDLPGFGCNSELNLWSDEAALVAALAEALPVAHLVGWSLGGNVAVAYARRYPQRVRSLSLIATNPAFVARENWPSAMSEAVFAGFAEALAAQPARALQRFAQLQCHGDARARHLVQVLRELPGGALRYDPRALADALAYLRRSDQRAWRTRHAPLYILGEADALVPVSLAAKLERVQVLPGCSHLPMLSQPQAVAGLLLEHMQGGLTGTGPHKADIARSFSAAAASYDCVAELQRQVGADLLGLLGGLASGDQGPALDLGCGTGYFLPRLQQALPSCAWLGGDLAEGMLQFARDSAARIQVPLLGLDAEQLPLADASLAGIYSNLAVQWCPATDRLFAEAHRALRQGGWFAFSTLLDGTLGELRAAWRQVDDREHVNRFQDEQAWRAAAERAGLRVRVWHRQTRVTYYDQLSGLVHELKALGAHNLNGGRPGGLTGKGSWRQLRCAYESLRQPARGLPASWEVLCGVLERA